MKLDTRDRIGIVVAIAATAAAPAGIAYAMGATWVPLAIAIVVGAGSTAYAILTKGGPGHE